MRIQSGLLTAEKTNYDSSTDLVVCSQINRELVGRFAGLGFSELKRTTKNPIRFPCNSGGSAFPLDFCTFFNIVYNEKSTPHMAPLT